MKRRILTCMLVLCLLLTMAGCGASDMAWKVDAAEERMEHRMDMVEDAVEDAIRQEIAPEAPPAKPRETVPVPGAENQITQEEAKNIALQSAGLTEEQIQHLRIEFEIDDGIAQYGVEFIAEDWEYEFEIDAQSGKILSYDRDNRWD